MPRSGYDLVVLLAPQCPEVDILCIVIKEGFVTSSDSTRLKHASRGLLRVDPFSEPTEIIIMRVHDKPLVSRHFQVIHVMPVITFPSRLAHQAEQCLVLCPALLFGDTRQVRGTIPTTLLRERKAETVLANLPRHWRRRRFKIGQQGNATLQGRKLALCNWTEAMVLKGTE